MVCYREAMLSMDGEAAGGLLVRQVRVALIIKLDCCQNKIHLLSDLFAGMPGAQYGIFAHYRLSQVAAKESKKYV